MHKVKLSDYAGAHRRARGSDREIGGIAMLKLNPNTLEITCPSGDTGLLRARITAPDGGALAQPIEGVAVYAVCQMIRTGSYSPIASKVTEIVDDDRHMKIGMLYTSVISAGAILVAGSKYLSSS